MATKAISQFAIGIVLAHLLGPGPFGVVAVAWTIIGFCNLVADFGFSAALVQRDQLTERDLRFISTCQVVLGASLTAAGIALAGPIARFFHRPDAADVLRAMACLFVLQSVGQTAIATLRRGLDFKRLQLLDIGSYLTAYIAIGIPAAYLGCGAWSLALAALAQTVLNSSGALAVTRSSLRPAFSADSSGMFRYGAKVIGANLTSWGLANLDTIFVGRVLGLVDLGYYNRANNLVAAPMYSFIIGFQGVLFSSASRAQADRGVLGRTYLAALMLAGLVCLPVFVTVAVVAPSTIAGLYGTAWLAAAPVLAPMALAMAATVLLAISGPVLMSIDRVGLELRLQAIALALFVGGLVVGCRYSMETIAWVFFGAACVRGCLLTAAVVRELGLGWSAVVRALRWPAAVAVLVAAPAYAIDQLAGFTPVVHLGCVVAIAAASLLLSIRILAPVMFATSLGSDVAVLRDALPGPVSRFLRL
jgi:PST family polysaccharide transporter